MYKSLLFSPDGNWVTDCKGKSIEEVRDRVSDLGSRWFFYPIQLFVIEDKGSFTRESQKIIEAGEPFEFLKGKSIKTARRYFAKEYKKKREEVLNVG